jgi:hypothetical protein
MIFIKFLLSWILTGGFFMLLYMIKIDGFKEIANRMKYKTDTFVAEIGFGAIIGYLLPIILFISFLKKNI